MLIYSVALFAVAAVFGLYLASRVLKGVLPPGSAAAIHGLLAASGLLILLYAAFLSGVPAPRAVLIAAALLVVAALGGFVLVSFHLRGQVPPKGLAVIHALVAVAGFLTLCVGVFGQA
jgi:hypothetical protein